MQRCRCGYLADAKRACSRAPRCAESYQNRLSGPLFDRFDLHIDVPAVRPSDLALPPPAEGSTEVASRILAARRLQLKRLRQENAGSEIRTNSDTDGKWLEIIALPDDAAKRLLLEATERFGLSARAYHRVLRVGRTIADLEKSDLVSRHHIAEALSYRRLDAARGPAPIHFRAAG